MMKSTLDRMLRHRFGPVALIVAVLVTISFLTRITLLTFSWSGVDAGFLNLTGIFLVGLFYDLVNAGYFIIPLVLYLWLVPDTLYRKGWHRFLLYGFFFILVLLLVFNAVSEWFFWDEFSTRYNFIAVDYLVYTNEVLGNIKQSYPIEWIVVCETLAATAIVFFLRPYIKTSASTPSTFKHRSAWAGSLLLVPVLSFFTINTKLHHFSNNAFVNELSGNGMYELFAAYRNNELDYNQFYSTVGDEASFRLTKKMLDTRESDYISQDPYHLERTIVNEGPEKRLNVVLISVESLSAKFMNTFGSQENITPNLDSLAQHSLLFTRLYATGTRTVRGLEALSLCIPPTPGQSIVRRPHNEHLFSLGDVFEDKGYQSKFIYGGYGYFDNMNYFFANNSYEVADRNRLKSDEIAYENIWGVADENLFTLATREIENTLATGKPVFAHVMTTSNHRPYTYPEGRIDIPSHTSRAGAVKYTDYAIGRFIKESSKKPWFKNTIFVIVADHCHSSAGATELPINKYHIPLLIYSPGNVQPGRMERLMSQIDLGPTLLGMLNFSYTSKFFGYDIFKLEEGRERIFISTYQNLGYLRGDKMIVLSPQKKAITVKPDFTDGSITEVPLDKELLQEAISWYQSSSYAFKNGLYEEDVPQKEQKLKAKL